MADEGDVLRTIFKLLLASAGVWWWADRKRRKREDGTTVEPERPDWPSPAHADEAYEAYETYVAPDVDERVEHWLDVVRVGEEASATRAELALEALGSVAVPALEQAFHDPALHVREAAERVLARIERVERRDAGPLVTEPPPEPIPDPEVIEWTPPEPIDEPDPGDGLEVDIPELEQEPVELERTEEPAVEEPPPLAFDDLRDLLTRAADDGDRETVLEPLAARVALLRLVPSRIERTSAYDASPSHRDGRTLIGPLEGTGIVVAARTSTKDAGWAAAQAVGTTVELPVRLARWDRIYDRATFEAVERGDAP